MASYLQVVEQVYADAAQSPDTGLCCSTSPAWKLPGLTIPPRMLEMNYGCGSSVDPRLLRQEDSILYVGVGGGLEALQFAYFLRRPGAVWAVDPVAEMRDQARRNLEEAARLNPWFKPEFVVLSAGTALELPAPSNTVDVAAQNCLFNVFEEDDLKQALREVVRVLRPGGYFATTDPIAPRPLPPAFQADAVQRARCLAGCQTFEGYLGFLVEAGLQRIVVKKRMPYRLLTPEEFPALEVPIYLESVEVQAYKEPAGEEGPRIFTGRTAVYAGSEETREVMPGQFFRQGWPMEVSDALANRLSQDPDMVVTGSTYHSQGGCC